MPDNGGKDANRWLTSPRRVVEMVIAHFSARFHI